MSLSPVEPQTEAQWRAHADPDGLVRPGADVRDLLLRISREMASASSVDEILQMMSNASLRIADPAERCVIHLLDARGEMLVPHVCSPPRPLGQIGAGISANVGIAGRALRERETLSIADTTQAADFAPLNGAGDIKSLLVAPLYVGETPLGTLSLSSSRAAAFGDEETQHIRTLAAQAAVVIRQARLLHENIVERQLSEAIIQSLTDGLVILDAQGCVQRLNAAMYNLAELYEPLTAPPQSCVGPVCPPLLRALLDAGGVVYGTYDMCVTLASGKSATFCVTPSQIHAPAEGEVRIIRDVTAERQSRREVYSFVSQVAHELRTPLQHIQSYIGLIREVAELTDAERSGFLGNIQDEVGNLALLVDDLLQLARFEQGRFTVKPQRTRLNLLVTRLVDKFRPRAFACEVALQVQVESDVWAFTDSVRVEQVLANVLNNALRYVPSGGKVVVTLTQAGDQAVVSVADNGPGIAPDVLPHIFEPFYQGSEGKALGVGVGLGLSISQQIMTALGGSIRASSRLGEGCTFTMQLPALPASPDGVLPSRAT